MGDVQKKGNLLTLLRIYARTRDVDSLAGSLDVLLDTPIERRILPAVRWAADHCGCGLLIIIILNHCRDFLTPRHCARFDTLLSLSGPATPTRRGSVDTLRMPRHLAATRWTHTHTHTHNNDVSLSLRDAPWASSLPSLTAYEDRERRER